MLSTRVIAIPGDRRWVVLEQDIEMGARIATSSKKRQSKPAKARTWIFLGIIGHCPFVSASWAG